MKKQNNKKNTKNKAKELTEDEANKIIKQMLQEQEDQDEQEEALLDNKKTTQKLKKKGLLNKIKQTGTTIKEQFVLKRTKLFKRPIPPKEPLLLLIQTDGNIKIIEGLQPETIFKISRKGEQHERGMYLSNNKLLTLPYAGKTIKVWIGHELETFPYPYKVKHDSSIFMRILEKVMLNYRELESVKWKEYATYALTAIVIIAVIIAIGYKLNILGLISKVGGGVVRPLR